MRASESGPGIEGGGRDRALADALPEIACLCTAAGACVHVNPRWAEYAGRAGAGEAWAGVVHPDDLLRSRDEWARAASGGRYSAELRLRRADGVYRWFLVHASPLVREDPRRSSWLVIATDIHDRKEATDALREAGRRQDEILAMLAHELRSPLAPIQHAVGTLELIESSDPALEHCRALIDRQLGHLVRMVDDLLDVSRITRGRIELTRSVHSVAAIVREAVSSVKPLIASFDHTLEVKLGPDLAVYGDGTRLVQVLVNVLTNAAKFTPPGGRITLRTEANDAAVEISVRDNGVGIEQDAQHRIFDLFVREHGSFDRTRGGLGIGLAAAKQLVELHGGSVGVESAGVGAGSRFVITLPRARSAPPPMLDAPRDRRPGELRIVIVEDNVDIADAYRMLLERGGHEVFVAHDGAAGLRLIVEAAPDLAFVDLGLPIVDGLTLAREVRATHLERPMLVAISGYGRAEDKRAALAAGFDVHLTKPAEGKDIESAIERARWRR
jgi:PAS domain S-box-containing protein